MRSRRTVSFLAGLVVSGSVCAGDPLGASFVDTFEHFDERRWFVSHGWRNGNQQGCIWQRGNVHHGAGKVDLLVRRLSAEPKNDPAGKGATSPEFGCAEIQTRERFGYGTYEARVQPAAASGIVSAFFTFIGPGAGREIPHDEIDFEVLGKNTRQLQINFFAAGKGGNEKIIDLAGDAAASPVDVAFDWRKDLIRWFVNGKLVHAVTGSDGKRLPGEPGKIYFSIWNGAGDATKAWLGPFDGTKGALRMSVTRLAYTRLGETCQFPESIVCAGDSE